MQGLVVGYIMSSRSERSSTAQSVSLVVPNGAGFFVAAISHSSITVKTRGGITQASAQVCPVPALVFATAALPRWVTCSLEPVVVARDNERAEDKPKISSKAFCELANAKSGLRTYWVWSDVRLIGLIRSWRSCSTRPTSRGCQGPSAAMTRSLSATGDSDPAPSRVSQD